MGIMDSIVAGLRAAEVASKISTGGELKKVLRIAKDNKWTLGESKCREIKEKVKEIAYEKGITIPDEDYDF